MTMLWRHEVSQAWADAHGDVLTASEIKSMLPEYKRMLKKPGGTISPGFYALCGKKLSKNSFEVESTGSAARGHIMEPYAIDDWNRNQPRTPYNHWDDCIIKRNGIGYSPDGLDIPQIPQMSCELWYDDKHKALYDNSSGMTFETPQRALEIKCYEPLHHAKSLIEKKEDREERLQVAVAFMVLPSLKWVDVLWYCPEAYVPMYKERYKKSDLKAEITVITDMLKMFHEHMKIARETMGNGMEPHWTTDEIYKLYVQEQIEKESKFYSLH